MGNGTGPVKRISAGCGGVVAYVLGGLFVLVGLTLLVDDFGAGVFGMALGGGIIYVTRRRSQRPTAETPERRGAGRGRRARPGGADQAREAGLQMSNASWGATGQQHRPAACPPPGRPVEPWGRCGQLEVEGEFARPDAVKTLLGHLGDFHKPDGAERSDVEAVLLPDPENPFDPKAVAVYLENHHVGYLSRDDARRYAQALDAATREGLYFRTRGRLWGSSSGHSGRGVVARANVWLPQPELMLPENPLPDEPHVVLPGRHTVQVTKEDEHHDVLIKYVSDGAGRPVAVELVVVEEQRARSRSTRVQVELDGERVGVLTPLQSDNLRPLVDHLAELGLRTFARAVVRGSSLKAEVVLNTIKAQDGDVDGWLAAIARRR